MTSFVAGIVAYPSLWNLCHCPNRNQVALSWRRIIRLPHGMMLENSVERLRWRSSSMAAWWIFSCVLPRNFEFLGQQIFLSQTAEFDPFDQNLTLHFKTYSNLKIVLFLHHCAAPLKWWMCGDVPSTGPSWRCPAEPITRFAAVRRDAKPPRRTARSWSYHGLCQEGVGSLRCHLRCWKWWWLHTCFLSRPISTNDKIFEVRSRYSYCILLHMYFRCILDFMFFISSISHEILLNRLLSIIGWLDLSSCAFGHCRLTLCGMPEDVGAAQEEAKNIMRQCSWPQSFYFTS